MTTEAVPSFLANFLPAAYWDYEPIQVAVCDDHSLFRRGLIVVLEEQKDIEVTAEADNGPEAASIVAEMSPDVVFVDMAVPPYGGVAATTQILRAVPSCRVVLLSAQQKDRSEITEGIGAGAVGALVKEQTLSVVTDVVRRVYGGGSLLSAAVAAELRALLDEIPEVQATDRESVVLAVIARGASLGDAAVGLGIDERVAERCLANVIAKLQRYWRQEDTASSLTGAKPATDAFADVAAAVRRVVDS